MRPSRLLLLAACLTAACARDRPADWRGKPCSRTDFPEAGADPTRATGLSFCADSADAYGTAILHLPSGDAGFAPVTRGQVARALASPGRTDWMALQPVFVRSLRLRGTAPADTARFGDAVFLVLLDWGGAHDCLQAHSTRREAAAGAAPDAPDAAIAAACADDGAVVEEAERARRLFGPP